jgi:hypothetical protein
MIKNLTLLALALLLALCCQNQGLTADISLMVQTEEGSTSNMDFGQLKSMNERGEPLSESSARTLTISVTNTTGKQYQVTQKLSRSFLNEMYTELEREALNFYTYGASTAGRLLAQSPQAISLDEQVIFISDTTGADDSFRVQYNFITPAEAKAGRYTTNIIYRVVTLE